MTIKSATTNDYRIASITVMETYGGEQLQLNFSNEMIQFLTWWQEWKPLFESKDPTVIDALQQAKVLHDITK